MTADVVCKARKRGHMLKYKSMKRSQERTERRQFHHDDPDFTAAVSAVSAVRLEKGRPLRAFVRTFGCQQNENDSEKIRGILKDIGYIEAENYEDADFILINTCSIRENADQRLFGHLGKIKTLRESRPSLICGVCGCLPTQEEQREKIKKSFSFVQLLFGPADISKLPSMIARLYGGEKRLDQVSDQLEVCEGMPQLRERRDRALVSIMYGCDNFCSYCVVPYTRGRERSRHFEDILRECREAAEEGIPEIMLLGQNVNAWGFDLFEGRQKNPPLRWTEEDETRLRAVQRGEEARTFAQLLAAISALPGVRCVRYMSSHPRDFTGEMLAALKICPEIENHLHLPLQAGSDAVLKAMNRHYDRARYEEIIKAVREVRPDISITTDLMVGFPGESEEDFQETLRIVREIEFEAAFTFIYSERPGTPAASREQIPMDIRHERFNRLAELQNRLTALSYERIVGTERDVILEGVSRSEPSSLSARDSEFHLINLKIPEGFPLPEGALGSDGAYDPLFFPGLVAKVKILRSRDFSAEGEILLLSERKIPNA